MYHCVSILLYVLAWFTLCFTVDSESHSLSPLLMAIAGLSHHSVPALSTVKHTAIMTPLPEMTETSVRFFPVTALLCSVMTCCTIASGSALYWILLLFSIRRHPSTCVLDYTDI